MEEEDVKADTAGDEEVKGSDIALDANATDNLAWNDNDPYFQIDDQSSGVHKTPVATSTPMSVPMGETVLLPPSYTGNEKLGRKIPTVEPELIDVSMPDYTDVPLVGFTRPDLSQVFPWVKFGAQNV